MRLSHSHCCVYVLFAPFTFSFIYLCVRFIWLLINANFRICVNDRRRWTIVYPDRSVKRPSNIKQSTTVYLLKIGRRSTQSVTRTASLNIIMIIIPFPLRLYKKFQRCNRLTVDEIEIHPSIDVFNGNWLWEMEAKRIHLTDIQLYFSTNGYKSSLPRCQFVI